MKKKRIITIVGARPQFIKAAALSRGFKYYPRLDEIIVHTGQHFDKNMSEVFFNELNIPRPKYSLNIHGGLHGRMTGQMLSSIEEVLMREKPDTVLVYGDTNSTLAGALAASKLHIPLVHIESGLRSFNKKMPEEINRILTDHISNLLFCPTFLAVANLKNEGVVSGVYHVGDIMYDATLFAKDFIRKNLVEFEKKFKFIQNDFVFMTIHRQESTSDIRIFSEFISYAVGFAKDANCKILFPVHPRIKNLVERFKDNANFYFVEPLSYFETQYLLSNALCVLTDSGGLQKEAYFHQVPCVTLRSETEWVETIESGWNRLWEEKDYNPKKSIPDYGDGDSAKKILEVLLNAPY